MSDEVEVPFGDNASETATLLLAAAEELDLDPSVVRTNSDGTFMVPAEVAKKSGIKVDSKAESETDDDDEDDSTKGSAKKAAPKKSAKK